MLQAFRRIVFLCIEIDVQHRTFHPVLFQLVHSQSFKKFTLPFEVSFKRRYQQTLPKATRAAEKIIPATVY